MQNANTFLSALQSGMSRSGAGSSAAAPAGVVEEVGYPTAFSAGITLRAVC